MFGTKLSESVSSMKQQIRSAAAVTSRSQLKVSDCSLSVESITNKMAGQWFWYLSQFYLLFILPDLPSSNPTQKNKPYTYLKLNHNQFHLTKSV